MTSDATHVTGSPALMGGPRVGDVLAERYELLEATAMLRDATEIEKEDNVFTEHYTAEVERMRTALEAAKLLKVAGFIKDLNVNPPEREEPDEIGHAKSKLSDSEAGLKAK